MNRWIGIMLSLVLLMGVLAGCAGGGTEPTPSATSSQKGEWPRTVADGAGHQVVIKEQPKRIAVLHPLFLDYFFALDVPAIASGSAESAMKEYATLQPYVGKAEIIDLGSGKDLNMEAIIAAKPDLIVSFKGHGDAQYDELSKIAPFIQIDYTDKWENSTMLCAQAIGKEELAEQLIKDTKEKVEKTKEQLGDLKTKTFALLRVSSKNGFTAQGTKNTVYYSETEGFGLKKPDQYPEEGSDLSLEALAEMNPDYIIIQHQLDAAQGAIQDKQGSAVWNSLKAVKNNQVLLFDNSLNTGSVLAIRLAADNFSKLAGK